MALGPSFAASWPVGADAGLPWGAGVAVACHSWEAIEQLQRQWLERVCLRCQEALVHGQTPRSAASWADLPMAGLRWSLQEWDQSLQDLLSAMLRLRGDWMMDLGRAPEQFGPWPPESLSACMQAWQQHAQQQSQLWMHWLATASRQREQSPG
jgi:hypothetical protein